MNSVFLEDADVSGEVQHGLVRERAVADLDGGELANS